MERRSIRLKQWPFDADEEVILHWLRSPWFDVANRQWRMTATFRAANGAAREMTFPWGMLSFLRLGQVFKDGELIRYSKTSWKGHVTFSKDASANIVPIGEVLSSKTYPLTGEANRNELCWVIQDRAKKAIVPVLDVIRALLAPTQAFAEGLLEPNFLQRVLVHNEIIDQRLSLAFSGDIPESRLTHQMVVFVAGLLHDTSIQRAWHDVYQRRFQTAQQVGWAAEIPLSMRLPDLRSRWQIRGLGLSDEIFVQEILEVTPRQRLPFRAIEFVHPDLTAHERRDKAATAQRSKPQDGTDREIDLGPEPPIASDAPRKVAVSHLALAVERHIRVIPVAQKTSYYSLTKHSAPKSSRAEPSPTVSEPEQTAQIVTFSGSGPEGNHLAGEVTIQAHQEFRVEPEDGLDEFAGAMGYIRQRYSEVEIDWRIYPMTREISFARHEQKDRKYAVVTLTWPNGDSCLLLEMGRPDGHQISSLLVVITDCLMKPDEQASLGARAIGRLLNEALIPGGKWRNSVISDIHAAEPVIVALVRHLTKDYLRSRQTYGEYLYSKMVALIKEATSSQTEKPNHQ